MPLDLEVFSQLSVIVYLTVEGDDPAPIRCFHRLIAAFEVNDREAPEAHRDPVVYILSRAIGSPVNDPVHHIGQHLRALILPACCSRPHSPGKSANSTHGKLSSAVFFGILCAVSRVNIADLIFFGNIGQMIFL